MIYRTVLPTLLLCLTTGLSSAASVDLTPPRNSLGYADDQGYFRMLQKFGTIRCSDGFELPLRFEFWTGRPERQEKSAFGWDGWHCGPLESEVEFYGGTRFLKVTLLCAKVFFLEKVADEEGLYKSFDGAWTGKIEGDSVSVSRADGWDLRFVNNVVSSLRTDSGMLIKWERDEQGKLTHISDSGSPDKPILTVEWNDDKSQAQGIALGAGQRVDLQYEKKEDKSVFIWKVKLTRPNHTENLVFKTSPGQLDVTELDGVIRRFTWNRTNKFLITDGLNQYRVLQSKERPPIIQMQTPQGDKLRHQKGTDNQYSSTTDENGITLRIYRETNKNAYHHAITRIEQLVNRKPVLVLENQYNEDGQLVSRKWRGNPIINTSFNGGEIERSLIPERETTYPSLQVTGEEAFAKIVFTYNNENLHTGTEVDGNKVLTIEYDSHGTLPQHRRITRLESTNRFERAFTYTDEGSIEKISINGVTDRKFGFVGSDDPTVFAELPVVIHRNKKNQAIRKTLLDGTTRILTYDDKGRNRGQQLMAADGKTVVMDISVVFKPQSSEALLIRSNKITGKTAYFNLALSESGHLIDRKQIDKIAATSFTEK